MANATRKTRRKHLSWRTKCAAAVLRTMMEREWIDSPGPSRWYQDAKQMTEDQFLSLFHFDHSILHETGHPDRDAFWNLTPMLIQAHRTKTKTDAAIVAKGRRIRKKFFPYKDEPQLERAIKQYVGRKLSSRGFDKTLRKKMDGTVVKRDV